MKAATRMAWAIAVAITVGLIASAARVERWLGGGGRAPRLVFEIPFDPREHVEEGDALQLLDRTVAVWEQRMRGRSPVIRQVDRDRWQVTVDGTEAESDVLRDSLTRTGRLEMYVGAHDTPTAHAWYGRIGREPNDQGVVGVADAWTNDRSGDVSNDFYLRASTTEALDAAIAQLEPVPSDLLVFYEKVYPREDAEEEEERAPYFRTYLVESEPWSVGRYIDKAQITFDQNTLRPEVIVHFNREGGRQFGELTGRMVGKKLVIVLDGVVASAPVVQTRIGGGITTITMGGADPREVEAEANALVNVLRTGAGAALPEGLEASLIDSRPGVAGFRWLPRLALAFLAALAVFMALPRLASMFAPAPVRPVARGVRDVEGVLVAAAITLGLPLLLAWMSVSGHLMLPGVNSAEIANVVARRPVHGVIETMSVFALGVLPIISAFWVVEIIAALTPRWRKLRLGTADRRRGLDRAALIVGFALAVIQGYFIAQFLAGFTGRGAMIFAGSIGENALVVLTCATGVAVHVIVADVISRRGLCNGYLALIGVAAARGLYHLLSSPVPDTFSISAALSGPHLLPGRNPRLALLACVVAIAVVTIAATSVRDRAPGRSRQPWPCLPAIVGLGEAIGLAMLLLMALAAVGPSLDLPEMWRLVSRPLWFDALFAAAAVALIVRWQRIAVTRVGVAVAATLLGAFFLIRWQAPPALAAGTLILPTIYATFLLVEAAVAIHARLGLVRPVAVLAVHDVDRADLAADALAAAGIPASVENLRLRAILRGLGGYAPIVIRVAAADAAGAVAVVAAAEADRDPQVAAFAD